MEIILESENEFRLTMYSIFRKSAVKEEADKFQYQSEVQRENWETKTFTTRCTPIVGRGSGLVIKQVLNHDDPLYWLCWL